MCRFRHEIVPCRGFQSGRCWYGADCKYAHATRTATGVPATGGARGVPKHTERMSYAEICPHRWDATAKVSVEAMQLLKGRSFELWVASVADEARKEGYPKDFDVRIDCRRLFPGHLIMTAGISASHDGRHPAVQAAIGQPEVPYNTCEPPAALEYEWGRTPWNLFCDGVVDTILRNKTHPKWEFLCTHGRHRSLGWATMSAALLSLLGACVRLRVISGASRLCACESCSSSRPDCEMVLRNASIVYGDVLIAALRRAGYARNWTPSHGPMAPDSLLEIIDFADFVNLPDCVLFVGYKRWCLA